MMTEAGTWAGGGRRRSLVLVPAGGGAGGAGAEAEAAAVDAGELALTPMSLIYLCRLFQDIATGRGRADTIPTYCSPAIATRVEEFRS